MADHHIGGPAKQQLQGGPWFQGQERVKQQKADKGELSKPELIVERQIKDGFAEFYSVHVPFEWGVFCNELTRLFKLVLVLKKRETSIQMLVWPIDND